MAYHAIGRSSALLEEEAENQWSLPPGPRFPSDSVTGLLAGRSSCSTAGGGWVGTFIPVSGEDAEVRRSEKEYENACAKQGVLPNPVRALC